MDDNNPDYDKALKLQEYYSEFLEQINQLTKQKLDLIVEYRKKLDSTKLEKMQKGVSPQDGGSN